jgi:hypothetical protein
MKRVAIRVWPRFAHGTGCVRDVDEIIFHFGEKFLFKSRLEGVKDKNHNRKSAIDQQSGGESFNQTVNAPS